MSLSKKEKKFEGNAIWISDLHLGSTGCQIDRLNLFLNSIKCNKLFLVGDIIDNWIVKKKESLPIEHQKAIQNIEKLANEGTEITYLPGNHDSSYRSKKMFYSFPIQDEVTYTTLNNKKYLIFHGDQLDDSMYGNSKYLSILGSWFYECCLICRSIIQKNTKKKNTSDFARWLKVNVKNFFAKIQKYDKKLLNYLDEKKVDGVICGHSHQPKIKKINNKDYLNSGDWIDNCSFLLEDHSGKIKLLKF